MKVSPLSAALGVERPIWNAGLGASIAGPELAAAVSEAGGLGVLGMGGMTADVVERSISELRSRTSRPVGVNLILPLLEEGSIEAVLDARVPLLVLFWGDASPHVEAAHDVGTKVAVQCGSVEEAVEAVQAGVDIVIMQGVEAGGHVRGTTGMSVLVASTVDAVGDIPVVASGGIADARGVRAALDLGAQAVSLGTRFLCSHQATALLEYKERVVSAGASDTAHTTLFGVGWADVPHRVLRNGAYREWEAAGRPEIDLEGGGGVVGSMVVAGEPVELTKYAILPPQPGFIGDIDQIALYAGQSCALIHEIADAGDIVRGLCRDLD